MPFSYRFKVSNVANTEVGHLYVNEPISEIESWTVEGTGNCLELSVKVFYKNLSIKPQALYRMQLQVTDSAFVTDSIRNLFTGYVTRPGADRYTRHSNIKLVGLKSLFKHVIVQDYLVDGADVGAMVRSVLSQAGVVPAGVNAVSASADTLVPDTSFSLGDYYPNKCTLEKFLNDMADKVEGAVWGVNGDGDFFFQVQPESYHVLTEGDGVSVMFEEPDVENTVDKVTLILADKPDPNPTYAAVSKQLSLVGFPYVAYPISHTYDSAEGYDMEALELLPITDAWFTALTPDYIATNFSNGANAFDEDNATYAECTGATGQISNNSAGFSDVPVMFRLRYSIDNADAVVEFKTFHKDSGTAYSQSAIRWKLENTDGGIVTQDFVCPLGADFLDAGLTPNANSYVLDVKNNTGSIKLYELVAFKLNTTILDTVAQAYIRLPTENSGEIQCRNVLVDPATYVDVVLSDGEELRVPTQMFTSSITKDGLMTSIKIGQPLSADEMVLNKLENDRLKLATLKAVEFRK